MIAALTSFSTASYSRPTYSQSQTTRRAPTNLTLVTPRWAQTESLISARPIGVDKLDESLDAKTPMLAGAVGAMFPFVSGSFAEPGVEYGTYALKQSPLILDRFNRETGYCTMVIGQLSAGISFSTKLQLLRQAMYDPETLIVMLDPIEGFAGVNEALGGSELQSAVAVASTRSNCGRHHSTCWIACPTLTCYLNRLAGY